MSKAEQSDRSIAPATGAANFAHVNLLPERTRWRITERRRGAAWIVANVCVGVVGLIAWRWSVVALTDVAAERNQLAQQQQRVRREERIGGGLSAKAAALQRQIATLDALRPPERWSLRLAELAAAVPSGTLLTAITIAAPAVATPVAPRTKAAPPPVAVAPEAPPVLITGYASEHARLAEFLRSLKHEAGFTSVRLVRSAVAGDATRPLVEFEILATR